MLFADSICASKAFTESFRSEMAAIFPDRKLVRIPADDPMLTTKYGGSNLKSVTRREPQRQGDDGSMKATDNRDMNSHSHLVGPGDAAFRRS